ncbi:hypothetical protein OSTOST_12168, partial [Ostertagia ostertagi]
MSDDTNSFYNGFRRIFPNSKAKKLLCIYHVLRAVERNCKANIPTCSPNSRSLERKIQWNDSRGHGVDVYNNGVHFARHYSCVNTSMLIERFHRRLKHEVFASKANVRVDILLDALISLPPEMEEDRKIKMARGLCEGRYRLQQHHRAHAAAMKVFGKNRANVVVRGEGRWVVSDGRGIHHVHQRVCICDSQHNNHCQKNNCGACPYGFLCDCQSDTKSGISCVHVHAAAIYGPEGKIAVNEGYFVHVNSDEELDENSN